jgi:hypothetical protein
MRSRILITICLLATGVVIAVAHDWIPHTIRARQRCGLPGNYRYQPQRSRTRERTVSTAAVLIQNTTTGSDGRSVLSEGVAADAPLAVRIYQQASSLLRSDHCAISHTNITLEADGSWLVNLEAEQRPAFVEPPAQPEFVRFKRNRFYVELSGLGEAKADFDPNTTAMGRPQYFRVVLPGFWVEQNEKRSMRFKGNDPNIRRYFHLTDRIEITLRYE